MVSPADDRGRLLGALERLRVHDHLCLIYETREEQFAAVIPFMRIGLERGEKCIYIADDNTATAVLGAMTTEGIDVDSVIRSGALVMANKRDAYLKQGHFDPEWMIAFLEQSTEQARASGFSALRATGEMTWMLGGDPGAERLMEYESKLNYFFPASDALAICQYNRNRFSPEILRDVIYTHPLVVYGNMVCRNLYYVPPDEFLKPSQTSQEVERLLKNIVDRESTHEELIFFRNLINQSNDAIFVVDPETGRFLDVNDKACGILGYESEELLNMGVMNVEAGLSDPLSWQKHVNEVREKRYVILEGEQRRKDGTTFPVEVNVKYVEQEKKNCLVAIARDITGRRRGEQIMQARLRLMQFANMHSSEELLQATLDEAEALTGSVIGFYHFLDADQKTLTLQAWSTNTLASMCTAEAKGRHYSIDEAGVWVDCVRERRAVIHNDYGALPHRKGTPKGHAPVVRELVTPVFRGDKIVAILGVGNKPADYDQNDVNATGMLADLAWDIAERKRAEEALRESEKRVRRKLDAILSPEGDIGALELSDIVDTEEIQRLMDEFYQLTNVGIGIIDLHGRVLVGTGWQDVCTKFHRINPESCRLCIESDLELSRGVPFGTFKLYRCKHNMWDMATPITIGDRHVGNIFLGQFLFDDETPDYGVFRQQARQFGFDEQEYMAALDRVPRWSRKKVNAAMSFYTAFAGMIGNLSYSNIKLTHAVEE
ncbi:MAG: MEDS domain-containing protein [Acidobacteriota bacterium]